MNDTVREELQPKISARLTPRIKTNAAPAFESRPSSPRPAITPPVAAKKREERGGHRHGASVAVVHVDRGQAVPAERTGHSEPRLQIRDAAIGDVDGVG